MSDHNWKAGDMALCVHDGGWNLLDGTDAEGPNAGEINTVRRVGSDPAGVIGLWFEDYPGDRPCDGYPAKSFRKIRPHAPDAEDAETIRLLKRQPEAAPC
ncbi:hypothetical protein D6851_02440 [Altericroceibacterium spongiae]|uniref:Uncharacterized protein n=1 Tax=Altericroceibacterium spongiae TaxID=2320269 RepID=A0A420ERU3_9SPHN|nr:hypothetical protein [Altericroceibacterium spongiae]RKF23350.1 hypothetical protein D6851_02440 [Altericroceibacterium spongiae]